MKHLLKTVMYGSLCLISYSSMAQAFTENFGSVSGTSAISTASVGFANTGFMYSGTADVRNTSPSTGYAGASGSANIFITNTAGRYFQIEGINTSALSTPALSFGISKSVNASNGSDFSVEVSTDGINYTALSFPALPTGSGTSHWYLRSVSGTVPSATNLRIRFKNNGSATQYRIDDVVLGGGAAVCSASITTGGATTLCNGGSVVLTANAGASYLWSNGATTQSISASQSATYNVTVTTAGGCSAISDAVRVLVYPSPVVSASATKVCGSGTSTITARTLATDLFFSEYVEGTGNQKYIEIYNGTGAPVNLAGYIYKAFHNGASVPTFVDTLSGILADNAVIVLKSTLATAYAGGVATTAVAHNGNDALALYKIASASYVDIFGVIGVDPVSSWNAAGGYTTLDRTLRRKSSVYSGITVNPGLTGQGGFTTLDKEWDLFATDDVSGLGAHTMDGTYSWSAGTAPSTGKVVTAAPPASSVYSVTGSYAVSGCSATATVQVNVYGAVALGIDNTSEVITLCFGDQCADISATPQTGTPPYTYAWSNGAVGDLITVCPTVSTSYSVTVTDLNGCSTTSVSAIEVINACCEGNKVLVCTDGSTSCVDSASVQGLILAGSTVGPCPEAGRSSRTGNGLSASVNDNAAAQVYPNPFEQSVVIEVKLDKDSHVNVEIMDVTGKQVAVLHNADLKAGAYQFNWNGRSASGAALVSGLYFCRIASGDAVQTVKLQKLSDK